MRPQGSELKVNLDERIMTERMDTPSVKLNLWKAF